MKIPEKNMESLLSKAQVAEMLNIKLHSVEYLVKTRQIGVYVICGKMRFRTEDIKAYVEKCRRN